MSNTYKHTCGGKMPKSEDFGDAYANTLIHMQAHTQATRRPDVSRLHLQHSENKSQEKLLNEFLPQGLADRLA